MKFHRQIPVNMQYENNKRQMEIMVTERTDIRPQLGMGWMRRNKLIIGRILMTENNKEKREKIFLKFMDLFEIPK